MSVDRVDTNVWDPKSTEAPTGLDVAGGWPCRAADCSERERHHQLDEDDS